MYIFKKALWIVLQQNDENIQLNAIIMLHVANESLRNFSLRRWGGIYCGIKNEVSSRVITVVDTDKGYLPWSKSNICPFSTLIL